MNYHTPYTSDLYRHHPRCVECTGANPDRDPLNGEPISVPWPCVMADRSVTHYPFATFEVDPVAALHDLHPTKALEMTDTYV